MKPIITQLIAGLALILLAVSLTACRSNAPLFCIEQDDQAACLMHLERSAKNYWEYRAVVQKDGIIQPQVRYDCRQQAAEEKDWVKQRVCELFIKQ